MAQDHKILISESELLALIASTLRDFGIRGTNTALTAHIFNKIKKYRYP